MFDIIFYKNSSGDEPIKDFLVELSKKAKTSKHDRIQFQKINAYLKALKEYGTRVGEPIVKHIDGDIWELRPLENRIFFFYWRDNNFILLHHYIKKSNKAPVREIEQARRNMRDFIERNGAE